MKKVVIKIGESRDDPTIIKVGKKEIAYVDYDMYASAGMAMAEELVTDLCNELGIVCKIKYY